MAKKIVFLFLLRIFGESKRELGFKLITLFSEYFYKSTFQLNVRRGDVKLLCYPLHSHSIIPSLTDINKLNVFC